MSRSRRPHYVRWKVNIDATLAARIELIFMDPIHGKPRYAERSTLIETLLREWLDSTHPGTGVPPLPQGPRRILAEPSNPQAEPPSDKPLDERTSLRQAPPRGVIHNA